MLRRVADVHDLTGLVEHGDGPDLGEVVVVGGDPEDGYDRPARSLRDQTRDLHRRHGFVEDVERTAEKDRLLAGDERGGLGQGESPGIGRGPLGAVSLLLAGERLREGRPRM